MNDPEEKKITVPEMLVIAFYIVVGLISVYLMWAVWKMPPRMACSISEISPDITPAERERCRMIRGHKL